MNAGQDTHDRLMLAASQLYYERNQTQDEIGKQLHLTRWKVGRLLEEARQVGIVQIQIVHPQARQSSLETELRERHELDECIVIPTSGSSVDDHNALLVAAVGFLKAKGRKIRTLGVSWGNTLEGIAGMLPDGWNKDVEVIQINGSISRSITPTTAANVAMSIARSGLGRSTLLPVPTIVEQVATKKALDGEPFVKEVLEKGRRADVLLFSLGALDEDSVLVRTEAITGEEMRILQRAGVCGDVLAHYIGADGTVANSDLESRTMGLSLDDLRNAQCAVAVAAGPRKVAVVAAALKSRLCSVLITDEATARRVLEK